MASSSDKRPDVAYKSVQAQILSRLSALEARLDSLQHGVGDDVTAQILSRLSALEARLDLLQHDVDNDVKPLSRCLQMADSQVTTNDQKFRNMRTRLTAMELNTGSNKIKNSAVITNTTIARATSLDVTQRDHRFTLTIEALQSQLVQVKQETAQLNEQSLQAHQLLRQQVQAITGSNHHMLLQHKFEIQTFINALQSSSLSKFQQLELLLNTKCIAVADYEQYKAIVDTLASDSVSRDKFYQLETIVNSLAHSQGFTDQKVLQSTEQQRTVIKRLSIQLEDLDTQHKHLQTFMDNCTRVSDSALRRTLDSQQVIVKTMQREVDLYRQDLRARMTSEMDILRQTLADVAINAILARSTSVQSTRSITVQQLVDAKRYVDIMSVSNSGELLIGSQDGNRSEKYLYIYDTEGRHVLSVKILPKLSGFVRDAVWTPRGNIVSAIDGILKGVVTVTRTGEIIATTKMDNAYSLSVSSDDVIYVACGTRGVYQSTDDGVTWSHVFTSSGNYVEQAIKVSSNTTADVFYVLCKVEKDLRLREYTLTKQKLDNYVSWRDVALLCDYLSFNYISMAFDGRTKVFVTQPKPNKTLRVFSVNQQTERTLDLSECLGENINRVTVDSHRNELYVSPRVPATVKVFMLPST